MVTLRKLELTLSMAVVVYMIFAHGTAIVIECSTWLFSHALTRAWISLPVGLELLEFLTGLLDVDGTIDELQAAS